MYEDLKKALMTCMSDSSCEDCIYVDDHDCNDSLLAACYEAIVNLEQLLDLVQELNNKMATELANSLEIKKEVEDGIHT